MTARLNKKSLPESWAWSTIGTVTDVIMGQSPPGDTYNQDGNGIALINGPVEFGPTPFSKTLQTKFTTQPTKLCEQGDLILCVRGSTTGRMNIAGFQACIGRGVAAIRAKADQAYINIFVHSVQQEIYEMGTGSTFPNISSDNIKSIKIPIAPLNEQHRIVAAIETQFTRLDAAVTALKRSQANLKRYRAAVLKAACEGRLVPTEADLAQAEGRPYEPASVLLERILAKRRRKWEAENPKKKYQEPVAPDTSALPELPEGWCWTSMEAIISSGPQNGLYLPRDFYGSGTPIMRIDDYQNGMSRASEELQCVSTSEAEITRYSLSLNDIVINRVNSMSHLGKCLVITQRNLPALFESNMMRLKVNSIVYPRYIELYLHSAIGKSRLIKGAKHAVNQASINQQDVASTPVPLPPRNEQLRIITEVERRLSLIDQLEKTIKTDLARANRLRQSILKRAFAGQLVPQDPNDEPASLLLARLP
jgi:type I restriction enzyme S subunit